MMDCCSILTAQILMSSAGFNADNAYQCVVYEHFYKMWFGPSPATTKQFRTVSGVKCLQDNPGACAVRRVTEKIA